MKKRLIITVFLLACIGLSAQNYHVNLHHSGSIIYDSDVNAINEIRFIGNQPAMMLINSAYGDTNFNITQFDSITFIKEELPPAGDTVYITYDGNSVTVTNPFSNDGVSVSQSGANVTVNSTKANVPYVLSGNSNDGSLTLSSNSSFTLILNNLSLTSGSTAALNLASTVAANMILRGTSMIADGTNGTQNAALYAAGNLNISGNTLRVTGNAKHGISVEGTLTVNSGEIDILDTDSDGIHGSNNLLWNGGTLNIVSVGSDGLDFSGTVTIGNGNLSINTTSTTARCIKVTDVFTMTGGALNLNVIGGDSKGIKGDSEVILNGGIIELQVAGEGSNGISSDTDVTISGANVTIVSSALDGKCIKSDGTFHMSGGSIDLNHSGNTSKGIAANGDITISNGTIVINSSGSTVVTNYDPSYCTAIRSDGNITISGGDITITLPTSNQGGRGIKSTGTMTISGDNTINIETHGDGATYTSSSGNDTYSSSCLRSEGNMQILSGNITLSSTGKGGKGIKVGTKTGNTYTGTYTQGNSDGAGPTLTISTTGAQVGGGGGGWPPGPGGGSSNRASAKGIKVGGLATINGGTTTVTTTSNGAEGLESKTQILINGGQHYFHCYDDCINSSGTITFEGGMTVCFSNGNDAVDSNDGTAGAITIGNGVAFAYTNRGNPEEGFDCDNNNYIRITGTGIGISAGGSQGGGWPGGGGGGGTITNPAQGYKFYTSSYTFQPGRYYTLSNTSSSGGTNMVTFSFESSVSSTLALITATGMVSGDTYYVKYGTQAPTNPTTEFHGLYLGGTSSASTQAFSFTAQ
ncbi:MAG: carbohydrate-binding domain-containing protein [Bacteroidales bacterium]|nr:carbohydrate-binding domain-containing protein [Bacteroidales bacterium]